MKHAGYLLYVLPSAASAFCFEQAGAHYNVSPSLLRAVAQVESGLNAHAYRENTNALGQVTSRDYGLMQINSSWFDTLSAFNIDESSVFEPCFNVSLGAWILASNFASHGYNWNSVGAYNAGFSMQNETARQQYISKVQSVYYSLGYK